MTRSDDAPLHERLEATWQWVRTLSLGREWSKVLVHRDTLREAAALLRPPEGEVGEVIERLEAWAPLLPPHGLNKAAVIAALAHLRRLGRVEAERDRLRQALEVRTWTEQERDGMAAAFALNQSKRGHFETLFAVGAWLLRHRRALALAPAPENKS